MHQDAEILVVGLGAMGSAALYHLARQGAAPVGIEQYPVGHTHGSSHGHSRAFRVFYNDAVYVTLAKAALPLWQELARLSGEQLLIPNGMLAFAKPGNERLDQNIRVMQETKTSHDVLTAEEVADEVTEALETAIQELQEVEEITSTSAIGLSTINVDVKYEFSRRRADLQVVWGKLRNRIRDARRALPPGALEPIVNDSFGDVYGLYYLITGDGYSPKELYDYAKSLRTELLSVDDVGKVAILGALLLRCRC